MIIGNTLDMLSSPGENRGKTPKQGRNPGFDFAAGLDSIVSKDVLKPAGNKPGRVVRNNAKPYNGGPDTARGKGYDNNIVLPLTAVPVNAESQQAFVAGQDLAAAGKHIGLVEQIDVSALAKGQGFNEGVGTAGQDDRVNTIWADEFGGVIKAAADKTKPVMQAEITVENPQAAEIPQNETNAEAENKSKVAPESPDKNSSHKIGGRNMAAGAFTLDADVTDFVKQALEEAAAAAKNTAAEESLIHARARLNDDVSIVNSEAADDDDSEPEMGGGKQQQAPQAILTDTANLKPEFRLDGIQTQRTDADVPHQEQSSVRTQIISQVKTMVGEQKSEFMLQLKPQHLGGLSILLSADDKGVVAKLVTSSRDAHNLIRAEMTSMQETLREKGINVVQMEVVYDRMANSTGKDSFNEQGHGWERSRRGIQGRMPEKVDTQSAIAMLMYDNLSTYDILAEHGGSVEFSA